jgi:hypothetical protein
MDDHTALDDMVALAPKSGMRLLNAGRSAPM